MIIKDNFLFFWGKDDYLSQWHPCTFYTPFIYLKRFGRNRPIKIDILQIFTMSKMRKDQILTSEKGVKFNCCEQFMMTAKAILFLDLENALKILLENDPAIQKKMGRKVCNYNDELWLLNREYIVFQANYHKYTQNENFGKRLINTNPHILVEASPYDKIWGIGLSANDSRALYPDQWNGLNLLGKALMKLRDRLIEEKMFN